MAVVNYFAPNEVTNEEIEETVAKSASGVGVVRYVVIGDCIDRGTESQEVLETLLKLSCADPSTVLICTRGKSRAPRSPLERVGWSAIHRRGWVPAAAHSPTKNDEQFPVVRPLRGYLVRLHDEQTIQMPCNHMTRQPPHNRTATATHPTNHISEPQNHPSFKKSAGLKSNFTISPARQEIATYRSQL